MADLNGTAISVADRTSWKLSERRGSRRRPRVLKRMRRLRSGSRFPRLADEREVSFPESGPSTEARSAGLRSAKESSAALTIGVSCRRYAAG